MLPLPSGLWMHSKGLSRMMKGGYPVLCDLGRRSLSLFESHLLYLQLEQTGFPKNDSSNIFRSLPTGVRANSPPFATAQA